MHGPPTEPPGDYVELDLEDQPIAQPPRRPFRSLEGAQPDAIDRARGLLFGHDPHETPAERRLHRGVAILMMGSSGCLLLITLYTLASGLVTRAMVRD